MIWDFAEANPFAGAAGDVATSSGAVAKFVELAPCCQAGLAVQRNATCTSSSFTGFLSTDPPYYDNIGYADLSDFFYVWLRRSLRDVYPDLLATIAVPKAEELIATPFRHGSKDKAEKFFLDGMTQAMRNRAAQAHPAAPLTIYYAFKESDATSDGTNSSGWETFLEALSRAGLCLTGTWPMRT